MPTNEFLEFCPTDTGTNLPTQVAYAADADRTSGNKPGVASSKLNNKALRQANFITSNFAKVVSDLTNTDTLDNGVSAKVQQQILAAIKALPPIASTVAGGNSGDYNLPYYFFIAAGAATAGATYTNNAVTFTVSETIAAGTLLKATGPGAPAASGTLTKASGTGDATLTFYAVRAPISLAVTLVGGGGGGAGSGTSPGVGGTGGNSTFGSSVLTANGGTGGAGIGGAGGTATIGSGGGVGIALQGGHGQPKDSDPTGGGTNGGDGGQNALGGAGVTQTPQQAGSAGRTNSGGGGAGGGFTGGATTGAAGGGAGGYIQTLIASPAVTYPYVTGAGGTSGTAGSGGGTAGGAGGSGFLMVVANYQ